MSERSFFDYHCDACGTPFCERIHVMNLALDNLDDEYCLECLAKGERVLPEAFYHWIVEYINARDCFKTPWDEFNAAPCARIVDKTCFCSASELSHAS